LKIVSLIGLNSNFTFVMLLYTFLFIEKYQNKRSAFAKQNVSLKRNRLATNRCGRFTLLRATLLWVVSQGRK
jgi:hypothetical protein